ncbi:MAG: nucleotidyltransferase family protein [Limisphaerales bacterium]
MKSSQQIGAIVLAAGQGRRMGGPKWQLKIAGRSFLDHVLQTLRDAGLSQIVCVVGRQFPARVQGLFPGVAFVPNNQANAAMLSSVKIGLTQLMDLRGVLIVPVDHPLVRKRTYTALMEKFIEDADSVVKPIHQEQSGHPILIPQRLFAQIMRSDSQESLNELIRTSNLKQVRLPCDDPGILNNINTVARHLRSSDG